MKNTSLLVILINFTHCLALYASRPYLSLLAVYWGADAAQTGLIVSMYSVIQAAGTLYVGRLIERLGEKKPLIAGAAIYTLGVVGLVFAQKPWLIGLCALFMGAAHCIILLSSQSIITGVMKEAERDKAIGYFAFANSAGAFVGPSIGGYMQDVLGVNEGFLGAAALSLISMLIARLLPKLKGEKNLARTKIGDIIKHPLVISNLLLSGAVFFASDIITTYLPLYGAEIGLTATAIGFVLSANGLAQMLIRPFLGHVCARIPRDSAFRLCLLMGGIGTVCLGLLKSFYPLLLAAIFVGLTLGLANPLTLITVSDVSSPENRNRVLALRLMSNYAGQTISPITFGALANIAGLASVFWGSGGVMLACFYAVNLINKKFSHLHY